MEMQKEKNIWMERFRNAAATCKLICSMFESVHKDSPSLHGMFQKAVANPSPSSQLGDFPPEEQRSLNYSGETSYHPSGDGREIQTSLKKT